MSKAANGPIIIKKVRKADHGGHHGGAWKVAYADFVTAMMAFFLLLWLLNVTTDEQKRGIADYFEPSITWHKAASGANGVLAGQAVGTSGAETMVAASPAVSTPAARLRQRASGEELDGPRPVGEAEDLAGKRALAAHEDRQFAAAEFDLRQAIQDLPEVNELAESLIVDRTPEGLRIQLVDQERTSMFPLGSSEMSEPARKLMGLVARIVERLPNKISVTGHTDAMPYAGTVHYSNWELSTDRANASRRQLLESGLALERIARVSGVADREPLIEADPGSPRNRRISIVLLREAKAPATHTIAQH